MTERVPHLSASMCRDMQLSSTSTTLHPLCGVVSTVHTHNSLITRGSVEEAIVPPQIDFMEYEHEVGSKTPSMCLSTIRSPHTTWKPCVSVLKRLHWSGCHPYVCVSVLKRLHWTCCHPYVCVSVLKTLHWSCCHPYHWFVKPLYLCLLCLSLFHMNDVVEVVDSLSIHALVRLYLSVWL